MDSCHGLGLSQINKYPNGDGNILDLIWSSDPDLMFRKVSEDNFLKAGIHHIPLEIVIFEYIRILHPMLNLNHIWILKMPIMIL